MQIEQETELHELATYCCRLVAQCIVEDGQHASLTAMDVRTTCVTAEMPKLQHEWQKWRLFYVENYAVLCAPDEATHAAARVFAELCHLWFLICRPALLHSDDGYGSALSDTHHLSWVQSIHSYAAATTLPWSVPIARYTQSQTRFAAAFLTQHMRTLQEDCVGEFRALFEALWCRMAVLSQEWHDCDTLDEENMREVVAKASPLPQPPADAIALLRVNMRYRHYTHCYMGSIMRTLFYHDAVRKRPPSPLMLTAAPAVATWLARIVDAMASEAFEDLYYECRDQGYNFAGDDAWFRYAYPAKGYNRHEVLSELRPHLYQGFSSAPSATKAATLAKYNEDRVARLVVLRALHGHVQTKSGSDFNWFLTVVRNPQDLLTVAARDFGPAQVAPLLFDGGLLGLWPYQQGDFYACDDLALALAAWFVLVALPPYDNRITCGGATHNLAAFEHEIRAAAEARQNAATASVVADDDDGGFFI